MSRPCCTRSLACWVDTMLHNIGVTWKRVCDKHDERIMLGTFNAGVGARVITPEQAARMRAALEASEIPRRVYKRPVRDA